ncbi:hypothetical protein AN958_10124 [Leucoagaricus sp. SymC.cos]|nr:hypothetical protein AN958_10124 [Leucoagaricus sp. SymC.cos]
MLLAITTLLLSALAAAVPRIILHDQTQSSNIVPTDAKVSVQLGVMSKCPDALLCEATFNTVLEKVKYKMDLSLVYIARFDDSDPDFGVTCLHGPEECAGNVQQLCVNRYATKEQWWDFVQCQNFGGKDAIGKPEVALRCAGAAQIDWETSGAGRCAGLDGSSKGLEGVQLLHESVKLGQTLNITTSCTILISARKICVHDSTWKECEGGHTVNDFVRQINEEYDRLN